MNYAAKVNLADTDGRIPLGTDSDAADREAKRRRIWIIAAIGLGLALAAYLLTRGEDAAPFTTLDGETPSITVFVPGSTTLEGSINATGTFAARRELPVGVVGEGGRVVSVPVEAGDWVREGQILAVIDRSVQVQQSESQAAQVQVAQADSDLAQANLDRALQLVERGFISQADIDTLTATRDAAVARVRVAQAQYGERQARNAQLNIVAPAAGLLLARNVEPGQVVGSGSGVLFSIARGGEMEVRAQVGESDLAAIPIGATGMVTPVGIDQVFTCQVWQKAPVIDEATRQGTARCALAYDPALRPGGFASVELRSGTVVAPRLPESAILSDDQGSYVFVLGADNKVVRRPVELGMIGSDGIAIVAGLDGSEQVVLRAGGFLTEGETIRPVIEPTG